MTEHHPLRCLDFFAGSGLVAEGLKPHFETVWANDISPKKARVFRANHPAEIFHLAPVEEVNGRELPEAALCWGSFPCQDLSLAGTMSGIAGERSGLVWQWLRVIDEMNAPPPLIVAENVVGLVSASSGENYRELHEALVRRGYRVGALMLDAACWLPQSRKRIFVIAARRDIPLEDLVEPQPSSSQPQPLLRAAEGVSDFIWWRLPGPAPRLMELADILDLSAPFNEPGKRDRLLRLIPAAHREKMQRAREREVRVFPGYKRMRGRRQVLELRFDGLAGCLRTPAGGSSRQFIVIDDGAVFQTRLLTVSEAARLMGAPESYAVPGTYNDGYGAMGDAVAVPVTRHLAEHLLAPLARRIPAPARMMR